MERDVCRNRKAPAFFIIQHLRPGCKLWCLEIRKLSLNLYSTLFFRSIFFCDHCDGNALPNPGEVVLKKNPTVRNKFTHVDLDCAIENILKTFEGVKKGTNEYNYLKSEQKMSQKHSCLKKYH